ncbi:helix-turn-helix domain-containing protein [Streptomyces phaeolivaceus]|uniref:Helix-turn-helix domain-containing protein n=1 Tax=Streptomyces phaeolivaceus TaxID=2653200 RepID=A0A5P8KEE4_9ACTN|nr:helix-turn-helix domain-containing protein [Streptomyces phaeolivaceus]QFR01385.1 helix-turn-helix domain-containing protein [Streptomyces phaeolivaceus]
MSASTESERFAACLRSLKERSGLSYAALAAKAGTSGSSVHRYCLGGSIPQDYGTVHRLAVACGATPEELRTLHRLWAVADAAREQEATEAEPEATEAGSEGAAPQGPESAESENTKPGTTKPGTTKPGTTKPVPAQAESTVSAAPAVSPDAKVVRLEPVVGQPEPPDRPGPEGHGRRWLRVAVAAGLAVLFLGGVAWTLPSLRSAGGSEAGPAKGADARQLKDSRPLFTSACREVVAMGQHDTCVREVQQLLHDRGAEIGVDGDFGPQTLRRVTAFQVIAGIEPPNGVVGDTTKKALYESKKRMDTWTPDQARRRIREVFTEAPDRAVAIADCQSFLDPLHILPNTNGTRNWGLFQISDARLRELGGTPRQALDPEWNIRAAKRLWSEGRDFSDWPHCDRAFSPSPSPSP